MRLKRRTFLAGAAATLSVLTLPAWAGERAVLSGRAFGGQWSVTVSGQQGLDDLGQGIGAILARIDATMSPFKPQSEITRFNLSRETGWQQASASFAHVAAEALRVARLSGGAFDPSVGPDVSRFGFGPIEGRREGSYEGFALEANTIRKDAPGLSFDLCGIAKGHALDAVADYLRASGIDDFLIEISGEIFAQGTAPDGAPWRIGITDPVHGGLFASLLPGDFAFATSGDAIHAYEVDGRRYSHIIDPATGRPVANTIASVTVGAASGMSADALATALMVMGPERGLDLALTLELPALFLLRDGEGIAALTTPAFDTLRIG